MTNSVKAHCSTIRLDPLVSSSLRLDPLNTSTLRLDPQTSSMLRPDPLRSSLPALDPSNVNNSDYFNSRSNNTPNLDQLNFNHELSASSRSHSETQGLSFLKPLSILSTEAVNKKDKLLPLPDVPPTVNSKPKGTPNHQNGTSVVVPLPDPPPNSCLKTGTLKKHRHRVHFKLPEDEEEPASQSESEDNGQAGVSKGPPPLFAKPRL